MKKKILIPIISIGVLIVIGIILLLIINKPYSYIIIDINPAFKINLDKNNKVMNIVPLDKDAKGLIKPKLKGKSYKEALKVIGESTGDYSKDNNITILIHTNNISSKKVENELSKIYVELDIHSEIIIIDKINYEDKYLAKKYKITELRASYINSIKKEHKDIPIEYLVESPLYSLKDTEQNGLYCDEGYFLDNERCLKEKERKEAKYGVTCPGNSVEENGVCYEQAQATVLDEYECEEGKTLGSDNKCHNTIKQDILGKCETGEYDHGTKKCKVKEKVGEATEICRITRETDILMDHKCYGPKPTINGGCLGNDVIINGGCVDLSRYYESDWECPSGEFLPQNSDDHNCYEEVQVEPTSFYCEEEGFKVINGECIKEESIRASKKVSCPEDSTKIYDRCIYKNKTNPKVEGYICDYPNSRLEGNICIIYEEKEAK
jgi:hypothetical protein